MERRAFLKTASAAAAALSLPSLRCSSGRRPNVLWIISEDTSPDLGCYGHPLVKTPHLDQLAAEGVRFTNTFASAPVCSPARSALNTGMYQTSIGAHQHRTWKKSPLPAPVRTISDLFREAGYYTCNARGLDFSKPGKTDWNFIPSGAPFDGTDWRDRQPDQPFFAQVNLFLTHRTFQRDPESPIDPDSVELPPVYPDNPLLRRDWANYLESIQVLDRQVGTVLQRLEEDGLAENTVVFYFGDHGRAQLWDKQWLYDGGIHVPLIVRDPENRQRGAADTRLVSLIDIAAASLAMADIPVPDWMLGRPFLCRGVKERDFIFAARDRCDETVDRIRCVRSPRYKYIHNFMPEQPYTQFNAYKTNQYPAVQVLQVMLERGKLDEIQSWFAAERKPKEELYDLENDPHETINRAGDPAFGEVLAEMRQALTNWLDRSGDEGAVPEDPAEIEHWRQAMAAYHERNMKRKGLPADASAREHLAWWNQQLLNQQ